MKKSTRIQVLLGGMAAAIVLTLFLPAIAQPEEYHNFADQRAILGIPNFLDVISNLGFLGCGLYGLAVIFRRPSAGKSRFLDPMEGWPWMLVFLSTVGVAFGSAYYHLAPENSRLFWDRLPMALMAMSLTAAVISERISPKGGLRLLLPLLVIGAASVVYWGWSEARGAGDLRFYGLVIFAPMLLIPLTLLLFPPRYTRGFDYAAVLGFYLLAKAFEHFDEAVFSFGNLVGGHALKHLFAAAAIYWLARMVGHREIRSEFATVPMAKRRRPKLKR